MTQRRVRDGGGNDSVVHIVPIGVDLIAIKAWGETDETTTRGRNPDTATGMREWHDTRSHRRGRARRGARRSVAPPRIAGDGTRPVPAIATVFTGSVPPTATGCVRQLPSRAQYDRARPT
jgi:hypothetical protein